MATTIEPATVRDVLDLAPLMRKADAWEGLRLRGQEPFLCLADGLMSSAGVYAVRDGDEVLAMFGVRHAAQHVGLVWSKYSHRASPRAILTHSREAVRYLFSHFPVLVGLVDADSDKARRWCRWLGFEVRPEVVPAPDGHPLHPILARRDSWRFRTQS